MLTYKEWQEGAGGGPGENRTVSGGSRRRRPGKQLVRRQDSGRLTFPGSPISADSRSVCQGMASITHTEKSQLLAQGSGCIWMYLCRCHPCLLMKLLFLSLLILRHSFMVYPSLAPNLGSPGTTGVHQHTWPHHPFF